MSPELVAACITAAAGALLVTGWRMEAATIPPTTEPTEGADNGAQALPAEDL